MRRALNFGDLQRAMNSGGLGQLTTDSLANIPLTGQVGETTTDQAIAHSALSLTASVSNLNWGLLAACVAGLFLFVELTSKK